ncbi:MAG: alanine racemase [Clostridia bacterium]|nr:alanine racemase [Clostridia bacterium]
MSVYIDTAALKSNFRALSALAPDKSIYCVLKSNAYGHGLVPCLSALLEEARENRKAPSHFALASQEEALSFLSLLKKRFRELPLRPVLLLLSPPIQNPAPLLFHPAFPLVDVRFSLSSYRDASFLSGYIEKEKKRGALPKDFSLSAEIKVETGMHRLGISSTEEMLSLFTLPHLRIKGIYSHFGAANDPASPRTSLQCVAFSRFKTALAEKHIFLSSHLSASAGFFRFGCLGLDGARIGLALYGVSPLPTSLFTLPSLFRPVKKVTAEVLAIGEADKGEYIGYGITPLCRTTRYAVLNIGYAQGIPQSALYARVCWQGHKVALIGSVCMEKCFADIGALPVKVGDTFVFFGEEAGDTEAFANACGISPYPLLASSPL